MSFQLSHGTLNDLDLLTEHRQKMWRDVHPDWEREVKKTAAATKKRIREKLSEGVLVGHIAKDGDGKVARSGCIWVREGQPRPDNPRQVVPYVMSMYTEKEFRHRGPGR